MCVYIYIYSISCEPELNRWTDWNLECRSDFKKESRMLAKSKMCPSLRVVAFPNAVYMQQIRLTVCWTPVKFFVSALLVNHLVWSEAKIIKWSRNISLHSATFSFIALGFVFKMFCFVFVYVQSVSFVVRHCLHNILAHFLAYPIMCVCVCLFSAWSFIFLYDRVMFFSLLCPKAVFLVESIHFQWTSFMFIEFYSNPLNFIQN